MANRIYNIIENYYSPMCGDWGNSVSCESSHGIIYPKCNFHCSFCNNDYHSKDNYTEYDEDTFIATLISLLPKSCHYKFSGGEQTINPFLEKDLSIVKEIGGYVFLDSNGSRPHIIQKLLEKKCVDVLGISLKGLSEVSASRTCSVKNTKLCWENVFKTLEIASKFKDLRLIVTYVMYNDANVENITEFAKLIENFPNVFLKINNLLHQEHHSEGLSPIGKGEFVNMMYQFLEMNPKWKDRMIAVNTEEAITDYNSILFL